jgi:hypothetical protein
MLASAIHVRDVEGVKLDFFQGELVAAADRHVSITRAA